MFSIQLTCRYFVLALLLASALSVPATATNVILIMADDLGYQDLACYGHPTLRTPVIDQLARDGVKLTSYYAGATVCTPSRMALLTGCYPIRQGWSRGVIGHIMPPGSGLAPEAVTIAELFEQQGYATALFGKWHLGDEPQYRPHRQGFAATFYINKSNNQTDALWRGDEIVEKPFDNRQLTKQFTDQAVAFIKQHADRPFLLYLPYSAPHFPVQAHPDWKGRSDFGTYGDVIEELDARIGELLAALEETGVADDTIVIFTSDNGPEPLTKESSAVPFRGKKWSALEGGTRVPCIVRWPGRIAKSSACDELIAAIDLLPTIAAACKIDIGAAQRKQPLDGQNLIDALTSGAAGRASLLYWHGADGFQAIRQGEWKLFAHRRDAKLEGEGAALFNLTQDPQERVDVSRRFPERVEAMRDMARRELAALNPHPSAPHSQAKP